MNHTTDAPVKQAPQKAIDRFGKGFHWKFGNNGTQRRLDVGEAIAGEGPGDGFAISPWILDRYESALRLDPHHTWLLKRLMKHAWAFKQPVYPSLSRIAVEARVSRRSLQRWVRDLESLGYLRCVGKRDDQVREYDLSGLYGALALCVGADPGSEWAKCNGGPIPEMEVLTCGHSDGAFSIDLDAIKRLRQSDAGV